MSFYENYIALCNGVGKTPSAVALEIGLSKPTVNRWKNGGGITDATAAKVADYFSVPIGALFHEANWDAFGLNFDCYLEGSGMTPEEFAEKMGYDVAVVNSWINRELYPRMETIEEIAKFFDLDVSDFTEDKSVHLPPEELFKNSRPHGIDDITFSIMCRSHFLSSENKELVLKMVNALSK